MLRWPIVGTRWGGMDIRKPKLCRRFREFLKGSCRAAPPALVHVRAVPGV